MERLTKRDKGGNAWMDCDNCEIKNRSGCGVLLCRNNLMQKLAAYEDMGLTPEEVKIVHDTLLTTQRLKKEQFETLRKYLQAEAEGRLVVLPCKVGDSAYYINPFDKIEEGRITMIQQKADGTWKFRFSTSFSFDAKMVDLGKRIFLTSEEAERALNGTQN